SEIAIDGGQNVEVFRSDEEPDRRRRVLWFDGVRDEIARRVLRTRARNRHGLIGHASRTVEQRGSDEVVVVHAGVPEASLVRGLRTDVFRREALDLPVGKKKSLRGLSAGRGFPDVAD